MTKMIGVAIALCMLVISCSETQTGSGNEQRPNILFIVADDLGYADLGCYGGIIDTPNLDKLAGSGTMFTNFHTAPTCAPTRAMFLTGNDNHIAGMGIQGVRKEDWGYEGHLTDRVVTIPQVLQSSGYHTLIAGKWHLGEESEDNPAEKGFERSFVLTSGAGNHSNNVSVLGTGDTLELSNYTENGEPTEWPEVAYSTELYTDKLVGYIEEFREDNKPFFALATYTSPHWPLQVDSAHWIKYQGLFDGGYERWREANLQRLIKVGILSEGTLLPPLNPKVTPWDSLSPEQQRIEARKMELYAGMVDHLDMEVGRLIDHLKAIGEYEHTKIIFMSDNGAAHEDFYYKGPFVEHSQKHFDNSYENMGQPDSYVSYGPQWAEASSAAFRDHKGYTREGGITAPMIISGHGVPKGLVSDEFVTLLDLAPTIYDWVDAEYPSTYQGNQIYPLKGETMLAFFADEQSAVHDTSYVYAVEQKGHLLIRKGEWKLVNDGYPIEEERFELYNIVTDITESEDLSKAYPAKREELMGLWREYQSESRILSERP